MPERDLGHVSGQNPEPTKEKTPTMSNDELMIHNPMADLAKADAIQDWSDEKKKDFVATFNQRVTAAKYILVKTAQSIHEKATKRKFISALHNRQIYKGGDNRQWGVTFPQYGDLKEECGRDRDQLDDVAKTRASAVLKALPPLKKAVEWIDKDTSKMIETLESLKKKGQSVTDALVEASEEICMGELDQSMSIGDFRKEVKTRNSLRRKLKSQLADIGKEGSALEITVTKRLYKGLPGLSEAVVSAILSHVERAKALEVMARRIEEQVMFGDSEQAMGMLKTFEADEIQVSDDFKAKIDAAVSNLKKGGTKQLAAKKKAKKKSSKKSDKKLSKKGTSKKGKW